MNKPDFGNSLRPPLTTRLSRRQWLVGSLVSGITATSYPNATLARTKASTREFPADTASQIRQLMESAIQDGALCGAVVAIGNAAGTQFEEAFGFRQVEPTPVPMTCDTVFDLASLTKPIATGLTLMRALEEELLGLDDPIVKHLPEFNSRDKAAITVHQLLTHQAGLTPDNSLQDYLDGPEQAWNRICDLSLDYVPGTRFRYSDVGFIVLGKLVERLAQRSLDEQFHRVVAKPLGLTETTFRPGPDLVARAETTEKRDGNWIQGEVHDPRAHAMGGVAGHAGLFSTVRDLAILSRRLLTLDNQSQIVPFRAETLKIMTADYQVPEDGIRGLAWDKRTSFSSNRGDMMSDAAFGHGGFTGTSLWIDPELDCYVIFLGNRLHPDGKGSVNRLAGTIGTWAAEIARSR